MNINNSTKKIVRLLLFIILYVSITLLTFFEFSWFTFVLTDMKIQPKNIDFAAFYIFVPMRTLITGITILVPNFKAIYNSIVISFFLLIEVVWTILLFFGTINYINTYLGSSIFAASSLAFICNLALLISLIIKFYKLYKDIKKTNLL